MANQFINDESELGPNWVTVEAPPIIPGRTVAAPSAPPIISAGPTVPQYLQGTIPPNFQHDATFVDTAQHTSKAPTYALMPLGPLNAVASTQAQGTTVKIIEATAPSVAPSIQLQTNGIANADQGLLNLVAGSGITLVSDSQGDTTITSSGGGGGGVLIASVTLTPTQIQHMLASPVQLVPAPGAGKGIFPIGMFLSLDFGTTAYSGTVGAQIQLMVGSTLINGTALSAALLARTSSGVSFSAGPFMSNQSQTLFANQALLVANDGSGGGEFSTGDSPLTVSTMYAVVNL